MYLREEGRSSSVSDRGIIHIGLHLAAIAGNFTALCDSHKIILDAVGAKEKEFCTDYNELESKLPGRGLLPRFAICGGDIAHAMTTIPPTSATMEALLACSIMNRTGCRTEPLFKIEIGNLRVSADFDKPEISVVLDVAGSKTLNSLDIPFNVTASVTDSPVLSVLNDYLFFVFGFPLVLRRKPELPGVLVPSQVAKFEANAALREKADLKKPLTFSDVIAMNKINGSKPLFQRSGQTLSTQVRSMFSFYDVSETSRMVLYGARDGAFVDHFAKRISAGDSLSLALHDCSRFLGHLVGSVTATKSYDVHEKIHNLVINSEGRPGEMLAIDPSISPPSKVHPCLKGTDPEPTPEQLASQVVIAIGEQGLKDMLRTYSQDIDEEYLMRNLYARVFAEQRIGHILSQTLAGSNVFPDLFVAKSVGRRSVPVSCLSTRSTVYHLYSIGPSPGTF